MGSAQEDKDVYKDEIPAHPVHLGTFYIGEYPVTQAVWKAAMADNPSYFKGDQRPVEQVSWNDAQEFIGRLNSLTSKIYRLPAEAEWEYAARGGVHRQDDNYLYAGSDKLKDVGWYSENSERETKEVGLKYPNELGLYDMSGNLLEWCEDQWHDTYVGAPTDGSVWVDREDGQGVVRVLRGGSWYDNPRACRVAYRNSYEPASRDYSLGFRLALSPQLVG